MVLFSYKPLKQGVLVLLLLAVKHTENFMPELRGGKRGTVGIPVMYTWPLPQIGLLKNFMLLNFTTLYHSTDLWHQ